MNFEKPFLLLLTYTILLTSYIFTKGYYSYPGAVLVLFSLILLLILVLDKEPKLSLKIGGNEFNLFLSLVAFFSIVLSFLFYQLLYPKVFSLVIISKILLSVNVFLGILFLAKEPFSKHLPFFYKNKFKLLFIIAFLLRILVILVSPSPYIDVFDELTIASREILHGKNPYLLIYSKMYEEKIPDHFGYLPGLFLFFPPVFLILKDIRFVYFFSDLLFIYLLKRLLPEKRKNLYQYFALIYLYNPVALFVLEQSWLEPFMLILLFAIFYLVKKGKQNLLAFPLAIYFSTKVIGVLLLPIIMKFKKIKKKNFFLSLFLAFLIIFPFFILNPSDFISDTIFVFFDPKRGPDVAAIALTFKNMLEDLFHLVYDKKLALVMALLPPLFCYFFVKIQNFSKFFLVSAFLYLGFYYFSFLAFCNYYYFISSLLLFSLIAYFS